MTTTYDQGDQQRLSINFTDYSANAADPDAINLIITQPDQTKISYSYAVDPEFIKDSIGKYHLDYLFTQSGRYIIRFEGTGTINSAEQTEIYIRKKA